MAFQFSSGACPAFSYPLTFDDGLQTGSTWSPDGSYIAYGSDRGGKFDIWVQQVSGGDPSRSPNGRARTYNPTGLPTANTSPIVPSLDLRSMMEIGAFGIKAEAKTSVGGQSN
jgi:Tol biopolymer transport system component